MSQTAHHNSRQHHRPHNLPSAFCHSVNLLTFFSKYERPWKVVSLSVNIPEKRKNQNMGNFIGRLSSWYESLNDSPNTDVDQDRKMQV
jgi:hypothetical protein